MAPASPIILAAATSRSMVVAPSTAISLSFCKICQTSRPLRRIFSNSAAVLRTIIGFLSPGQSSGTPTPADRYWHPPQLPAVPPRGDTPARGGFAAHTHPTAPESRARDRRPGSPIPAPPGPPPPPPGGGGKATFKGAPRGGPPGRRVKGEKINFKPPA